MLYLSILSAILKTYCHILSEHPRTCLIANSRAKIKIPKLCNFRLEFECSIAIFEINTLEFV